MKTPSLRTIYTFFFLLGLFFIPFNSYAGFGVLGEYSRESAILFFIVGMVFLGIEILLKNNVVFPYRNLVFITVLLFLFWCILATVFNYGSLGENYFKGISGVQRFVRQYISLILVAFFCFLFFINTLKNYSPKRILMLIRSVFLGSLLFISFYGLIETLILVFGVRQLIPVLELFNYIPFVKVYLSGDRISGVSYETPALAMYLITITGWMLSYIMTSKKIWRFLPAFLILELTFFSGSRTGLVVISFQFLVFFAILFLFKKYQKDVLYLFSGLAVAVAIMLVFAGGKLIEQAEEKLNSLDFEQNLLTSISNRSRFGMQYAAMEVFKDEPIVGVGYGQVAYAGYKYYPAWAITDNYEFRLNYKNQRRSSFPPVYNLYLRLAAETGIVGLLLFLGVLLAALYRAFKLICLADESLRCLGFITLISVLGFSLNWFQIDSFRTFGFWVCLAILSIPLQREKTPDTKIESSKNNTLESI